MSEGLNALKELKESYGNAPYIRRDLGLPQTSLYSLNETIIPIIEKDLKKYEKIEEVLEDYGLSAYLLDRKEYPNFTDFYELVRYPTQRIEKKEAQALEILKKVNKTSLLHFIAICVKDDAEQELLKEILWSK